MEMGFELSITCSYIMINSHLCQKLKILGECDYNHLTIILTDIIPSIMREKSRKKIHLDIPPSIMGERSGKKKVHSSIEVYRVKDCHSQPSQLRVLRFVFQSCCMNSTILFPLRTHFDCTSSDFCLGTRSFGFLFIFHLPDF